jgi:hypothetical protein
MTTTTQSDTFELFIKVIKKWLIDLGSKRSTVY